MHPAYKRFFKYTSIGVSTFAFDLLLLYIIIDRLHVHYVVASGIAYVIAVSINYYLSRKFVFKGSARDIKSGYVFFLLIGLSGLLFVTVGMYIFVSIFGFPYVISRIMIAAVAGLWNYLMNLFVNFKVVGVHE